MKANLSKFPVLLCDAKDSNFQFEYTWKRKNGNKIIATVTMYDKNIPDPNMPIVDKWDGQSVCKPTDEFDAIFGMRQAVTNLFRKTDFDREDRTNFYEMFDALYGRGLCVEKF